MAAISRKSLILLNPKNCYSVIKFHALNFSSSRRTNLIANCPSISYLLINRHQFSPETASQLASILTRLKNPHKSDTILSFLRENGFSNSQLEKIVKYMPQLFVANLEKNVRPKLKIFQDMGFSNIDIADIITKNPFILQHSANNRIIPVLSVLSRLLGSRLEVVKLLKCFSWYFSFDLEKNFVPNIEFMKSYGIPEDLIIRHIFMAPNFFLRKPEHMRKFLDKANEMGYDKTTKTFLYVARMVGPMSDEAWKLKLNEFKNMGFSENDMLKMFKAQPSLLVSSKERMKKVKKFLLEYGKYDISCIATNPSSFTYSIQNRYIPRLQVLRVLEKKNLLQKWPSLSTLSTITDAKFYEKFVAPHLSEVGDIFVPKKLSVAKET